MPGDLPQPPPAPGAPATLAGAPAAVPDAVDWADCQACLAGDQAACTRLLRRYESEIARQVRRFSRDPAASEELVQEVMVETYLSLKRYRRAGVPMLHWLRRIATRVGYRFWKKQARQRRQAPLEAAELRPAARGPDPLEPAEAAALLQKLLGQLVPADRLVLTLMYFDDASVQEIAEQTGWNRAMVKMRAMRARRKLKALIEGAHLVEVLQEILHGNA